MPLSHGLDAAASAVDAPTAPVSAQTPAATPSSTGRVLGDRHGFSRPNGARLANGSGRLQPAVGRQRLSASHEQHRYRNRQQHQPHQRQQQQVPQQQAEDDMVDGVVFALNELLSVNPVEGRTRLANHMRQISRLIRESNME
ncbi:hypothetical protein HK105_200500 [Polyrhizophydium stewartii]|uniref:Uncharacterized protein n=1 Tax=Polyrhizophydium stewartii TaxID=2732419 RepID=A0ABR4NJ78_9FUNG